MIFKLLPLAALVSVALAHIGPETQVSDAQLIARDHLAKRCASASEAMFTKRKAAKRATELAKRWTPHNDTIQNTTCILDQDVTPGPYQLDGDLIRQNITDGEVGIPMILEIGVLDVLSCEPLANAYVDIWHCNSTGYYSKFTGVDPNEDHFCATCDTNTSQSDNLTFLRGIYPTDENGVVEFASVIPGYYYGRATHIHAQVYKDVTVAQNGSVMVNDTLFHTSQFYFTDEFNAETDQIYPYSLHSALLNRTLDVDDTVIAAGNTTYVSQYLDVTYMGDTLEDGIYAYITVGVDSSASGNNCTFEC
ncbi:aromatic compound dioxygenase [Stereum hirsutum FP-91666 SS1]|uniref:aromatic compound dioxygenase n=1 Tax=Stereum hirsutum (strain FP-91666) TaxID=721885 RepID=UPI0004449E74|nr:aromatic compound dioxygenase [Stereum hirsutum FP-91666 SS1]EIM81495.1 aromatic compound dioxygenase [Stereum hirsutum FP-91666 SS1]